MNICLMFALAAAIAPVAAAAREERPALHIPITRHELFDFFFFNFFLQFFSFYELERIEVIGAGVRGTVELCGRKLSRGMINVSMVGLCTLLEQRVGE